MDKDTKKILTKVFIAALGISFVLLLVSWFGLLQTFFLSNPLKEISGDSLIKALDFMKWTGLALFLFIGVMLTSGVFGILTKNKNTNLFAVICSGLALIFAISLIFISIGYIRNNSGEVNSSLLTTVTAYQTGLIEISVLTAIILFGFIIRLKSIKKAAKQDITEEAAV